MQLLPITHFFKTANDHGAKLNFNWNAKYEKPYNLYPRSLP